MAKSAAVRDDEFTVDEDAIQKSVTEQVHRLEQATSQLAPLAKDINVRFAKASQYAEKADDFKLGATLSLAQAEKICNDNGLNFKTWTVNNVPEYKWEYLRKLVKIGKSENPQEMLRIDRERGAKRAAEHYERQKLKIAAAEAAHPFTPVGEDGPHRARHAAQPLRTAAPSISAPPMGTPDQILAAARPLAPNLRVNIIEAIVDTLSDDLSRDLLEVLAGNIGVRLAGDVTREQMEQDFRSLSAEDRMPFARWAAEQVGAMFTAEG